MSKRLTRKEIKHDIREDEVRNVLEDIFLWLQDNTRLAIGLVVGLVVLMLLGFAGRSYLTAQGDQASAELAAAMKLKSAPILTEGSTPDDPDEPSFASEELRSAAAKAAFEAIRGQMGASVAGDIAGLYLADYALAEGNLDSARQSWEEFLGKHQGHALAMSVKLNLIRLDRQQGRSEALVEELRSALASSRHLLPEDALLFELAQTLEQLDRGDEAVESYQQILDDHPSSPFAAAARERTSSVS